ncbi:HAD-IIA family hydrolase [Rarobacter incanus]|uniref:HAD superfamily hydrolase (TIGR01450 family) n=1 Tax=Rarobacter incanus TaxID=153494 RepID=A0A542SLN7_9MICO|nr:HAD-IIA family hydrolase [Rarobacter incanus]TQK75541.1 HAD superfamily hydrolase (TIGR01450 family) [Rarobacter incanus]
MRWTEFDLDGGLVAIDRPIADVCDIALIDLDGVAYRGHEPVEDAARGIGYLREQGASTIFITNNASRLPQDVAAQLSSLDIPTRADEVLTAAQACARLLGTVVEPGSNILVIGAEGLRVAVSEAGYRVVDSADDAPAAVAQGFGPELGWKDLAEAAYAIASGVPHVASNLDLSLPTARGFAPGNGSLVRAVQSATGVVPLSAGKPSPAMYDMAVKAVGARRPLVIGDRLDTDLAGARSGGYLGLLVLTGVSTGREAILAPPELRPHLIVGTLAELAGPHPAPQLGANGWWELGASAARVIDGVLEVSGAAPGKEVELIRACASAAWDASDHGIDVDPASVPDIRPTR